MKQSIMRFLLFALLLSVKTSLFAYDFEVDEVYSSLLGELDDPNTSEDDNMVSQKYAIKVEFSGTSMTIELHQKPKVITENGNIVLKTNSMSVSLSLPCKITLVGASNNESQGIVTIRNNDRNLPLNVYTIDGKKIGTLNDKKEVLSLERGLYIINGKKVLIK